MLEKDQYYQDIFLGVSNTMGGFSYEQIKGTEVVEFWGVVKMWEQIVTARNKK